MENEFSGCLYETPTADGGERDWRLDPVSGEKYPFDLTLSEVKSMSIEGVPIRLEHVEEGFERGDEVGRVTEVCVHPVTGYTACKFTLHDTIAGRSTAELIKNDTLRSLSLGHDYDFSTGATTAKEVSICFEGARKGTHLYKQLKDYDEIKKEIMSTQQTMDAAAAPPAETSVEPAAAPAEEAAPVAAQEAPAAQEKLDLTGLLHKVCEGQPPEIAEQLFAQVAGIAERVKNGDESAKLAEEKALEMTKQIEALQQKVDLTNQEAKQKAEECVKVFNALMKEYVGPTHSEIAYNPDTPQKAFESVAHSVPVLASALHRHQTVQAEQQSANLTKLGNQIRNSLFSAPTEPIWKPAEPVAATVAVNASGRAAGGEEHHAPKRYKSLMMSEKQMSIINGIGGDLDDTRMPKDLLPASAQRMS